MRSIIEAIQELNRRTATFNCNVSFQSALEAFDTVETGRDEFACDMDKDGLPAARNGAYDMPSVDGTGTADIAALQEAINSLRADYTNLQNEYALFKAAMTIETFTFKTRFTLSDAMINMRTDFTKNTRYVEVMYKDTTPSHLLTEDTRQHVTFMPVISATADQISDDTSGSLEDIIKNYNIHDIMIDNGVNSMVGFPVQRYSRTTGLSKLACIMGTTNTICALGYPILEIFVENSGISIRYTNNASAGEFEEAGDSFPFGVLGDKGVSISIRYTKNTVV